ncbi:uncharacterized protein LOC131019849 isoform X1 [Salvia miltiorrhiza]|uniref:uncharacterized protein LOC131019849 isoform X1 n=2 Tax=Salvia miltiorrhiza TaxID=226208 RepID=UPI0025AC776C|nr:uncharacterized protein LOC131019849 isoform X1 [Salvia miltiorrhiza]
MTIIGRSIRRGSAGATRGGGSSSTSVARGGASSASSAHPASSDVHVEEDSVEDVEFSNSHTSDIVVDGKIAMPISRTGVVGSHKKMSSVITTSFKKVKNPNGFNWKLTPNNIKKLYFDEFKKVYTWPEKFENQVYKKWSQRAAMRYSDFVHNMKLKRDDAVEGGGMPGYIDEDAWKDLCEYWDTESVKAKSEKARQCKLSEPDGPGTGIVKHKGGSKSVEDIAQELAAAKGVPVSSVIYDSFRALHVKKDGTYTDKKSERIDVEVQEIATEMGQSNPDTPVDMNKIYLDVLGGGLDKKQRLFGTGSLALTLKTNISGESSTSAMSDIDKEQYATRLGDVEEQLQEERKRTSRLEEQVKVAMEIIKQLQGQSSSATSHPDPPSHVP